MTQLNDRAAGRFPPVRIAAAVILDDTGRVLLVRKRGSLFFMQAGGKLEDGETALDTLARELNEELGCTLLQAAPLGIFSAWAANEVGHIVEAALFLVETAGDIKLGAEIEEFAWVQPSNPGALRLAPLTRHHVLPLILSKDLKKISDAREPELALLEGAASKSNAREKKRHRMMIAVHQG